MEGAFVLLEYSVKVNKRLHSRSVVLVLCRVLNFYVESYRHEIKGVLLGYFTVLLHNLEQVKLLRK